MKATSALFMMTVCMAALPVPHECIAAAQSDAGSAPAAHQKSGKSGGAARTESSGISSAGKPNQRPAPRDPGRAVDERLQSGQMDKPIAQGEVSDRLNQLYSESNHVAGDTAAEHLTR